MYRVIDNRFKFNKKFKINGVKREQTLMIIKILKLKLNYNANFESFKKFNKIHTQIIKSKYYT